jgi:hypothetical protein
MADAFVRTASLETRVDVSRHSAGFFEALGAVWSEMAYGLWRKAIGADAGLALDIIVHDVGLVRAASSHAMSVPKARLRLKDALRIWAKVHRDVRDEVSEADLLAAQAGLI